MWGYAFVSFTVMHSKGFSHNNQSKGFFIVFGNQNDCVYNNNKRALTLSQLTDIKNCPYSKLIVQFSYSADFWKSQPVLIILTVIISVIY